MTCLSLTMISCGMDVDVKDSTHKVDTNSKVEVNDSEHKIRVETTLDRVLEICGILLADGSVLTYDQWTDEQDECFTKLKPEGLDGRLSRLQEKAEAARG